MTDLVSAFETSPYRTSVIVLTMYDEPGKELDLILTEDNMQLVVSIMIWESFSKTILPSL